jgi:fumarylacetoacetate (FAA) hydrolase family protein
MAFALTPETSLPSDRAQSVLVGRAFLPSTKGPAVVAVRGEHVVDLSRVALTMSELIDAEDCASRASQADAPRIGAIAELLANSVAERRDPAKPFLLAPIDLQAIKAAGVTFARSTLERVIEEMARGDLHRATEIRSRIEETIGGEIRAVQPGSEAAADLKRQLQAMNLWSQYLEVAIGPDAEIFTKAQPLSAVGTGADIGVHPKSAWNNPEPEVVLAVASDGSIRGATLGNDVNLRDFEGRSALLLSKAKDNTGSTAIGPFIRLFDESFGIADVRRTVVELTVEGTDGFRLEGRSSMSEISRDPEEIVAQAVGANNQYPDGFALFLGTMFAPTEDRGEKGAGFTHKTGDVVTISAAKLGALVNTVATSDRCPRWEFGAGALMRNLAKRGLL